MQKVFRAPKQITYRIQRYIKGRYLPLYGAADRNKREFGAKNPCWGTGMQFAPL
jgi:hypothetical protein